MADMSDSVADSWGFQLAAAEQSDQAGSDRSWVSPIQSPLVRAAAATTLRRLHPFTSHNHLCFATRPAYVPDREAQAPISVAWTSEPNRYIVYRHEEVASDPVIVMETADPQEAADRAARELADWPGGN